MRVLFDTDVVLDLVLDREPFVEAAAALFEMHERGRISVCISGITLVNVFYVTRKIKGNEGAPRRRRTLDDVERLHFGQISSRERAKACVL